jgi:hypothetical protein
MAECAGVPTLIIRLALYGSAFDLFGDKIVYTDLGRSVVNGGFCSLAGHFSSMAHVSST